MIKPVKGECDSKIFTIFFALISLFKIDIRFEVVSTERSINSFIEVEDIFFNPGFYF